MHNASKSLFFVKHEIGNVLDMLNDDTPKYEPSLIQTLFESDENPLWRPPPPPSPLHIPYSIRLQN